MNRTPESAESFIMNRHNHQFEGTQNQKMYKIFIYSLPRECTCQILTEHFLQYIKHFKVKRSKNKGRKAKIFAVLEVFKKSDITKIFAHEHYINGKKLIIKPFNKKKTKCEGKELQSKLKLRFEKQIQENTQKQAEQRNTLRAGYRNMPQFQEDKKRNYLLHDLGSNDSGVLSADFQPKALPNFKGLDWEFIRANNLNNLNLQYRLKKNSKAEMRSSSSDDSYNQKRKQRKNISSCNSNHRSNSERKSRQDKSVYFIQNDERWLKKSSDEMDHLPGFTNTDLESPIESSMRTNTSVFPHHQNPFHHCIPSEQFNTHHLKYHESQNNLQKKLHTTTSNYNTKNQEWSISASIKRMISNPTNKQDNSSSYLYQPPHKKQNKVSIEGNYHFNDQKDLPDSDNFSLLNCPSSNGMAHNYDTLVQDNEVTPADHSEPRMHHYIYDFDHFGGIGHQQERLDKNNTKKIVPDRNQNRSSDQLIYFLAKRKKMIERNSNDIRTEMEKIQFEGGDNEKNAHIKGKNRYSLTKEEALRLLGNDKKQRTPSFSSQAMKDAKKVYSSNVSFPNFKSSSYSDQDKSNRSVKIYSLRNSANSFSLFGAGKNSSHNSSFSKPNLGSTLRKQRHSQVLSDSNLTFKTQSYSFSFGGTVLGNSNFPQGKSSSKNSNPQNPPPQNNKTNMEQISQADSQEEFDSDSKKNSSGSKSLSHLELSHLGKKGSLEDSCNKKNSSYGENYLHHQRHSRKIQFNSQQSGMSDDRFQGIEKRIVKLPITKHYQHWASPQQLHPEQRPILALELNSGSQIKFKNSVIHPMTLSEINSRHRQYHNLRWNNHSSHRGQI